MGLHHQTGATDPQFQRGSHPFITYCYRFTDSYGLDNRLAQKKPQAVSRDQRHGFCPLHRSWACHLICLKLHSTITRSVSYSYPMLNKIPFQEISKRLAEVASTDLLQGKESLERNFRAILQSAFESMNVVSREEFEVQKAVLAATRERVERLEAKLSELENQLPPS